MVVIDTQTIRELRKETGEGMRVCYCALMLCKGNSLVAQEYLRLRSQALSRKKRNNDGELVPWGDEDYIAEAYKVASEILDNL